MFDLTPSLSYVIDEESEEARELVEDFSDDARALRATLAEWALGLTNKLDSLEPEIRKQLFYEIGDWAQYMRLLHQVGKEWVDKYLGGTRPVGEPVITNFPQFLQLEDTE